jgi:hypothetical protein
MGRGSQGDVATRLDALSQTARAVFMRRRRDTYKDGFGDGDLTEVLCALDAAAALLPAQELAVHMTEDTPTRFDIHSLPGMISLLTTLRGGGLQQHIAGLDLRLQTVLADQRLLSNLPRRRRSGPSRLAPSSPRPNYRPRSLTGSL